MRWLTACFLLTACAGSGSITLRPGDPGSDTGLDRDTDGDSIAPDCDRYGVSVDDALLVDHGSWLTGPVPADSRDPNEAELTSVSVNSPVECAVEVRNGLIAADTSVSPDGYPDVVICTGRLGDTWGDEAILDQRVAIPGVPTPSNLPRNGGDRLLEWRDEARFTVDRVFDDLRVRTRGQLTLDGDLDIVVNGDLEINNAVVQLTPGSEADIWVGGEASMVGRSEVNAAGSAGALRIHLLGGGDLRVDNASVLHARVRAPQSGVEIRAQNTRLEGTIAARDVQVLWGARVAVDKRLICAD